MSWVELAAEGLEPTMEQIAQDVLVSRLPHADETGVRLCGKLHWEQVNSTRWLTYLVWRGLRGRVALEAIGIWPCYRGRCMRDRWVSYDWYAYLHSVCGAHLLRDLTYEQEHQVLVQRLVGQIL